MDIENGKKNKRNLPCRLRDTPQFWSWFFADKHNRHVSHILKSSFVSLIWMDLAILWYEEIKNYDKLLYDKIFREYIPMPYSLSVTKPYGIGLDVIS